MEAVQFIQTTPQELERKIREGVKSELSAFLQHFKPKEPNDYMTRQQVAEMLDVDLSTVHNWTKKGTLTSYGINGRVYYIRSEVEQSLKKISV